MSELLESVRRSFYHDILSFSDAEARLEGKERESDVKSGMFLISYVKNSSVSHILTPRKDGKYFIQTVGSFRLPTSSQPSKVIFIQFLLRVLKVAKKKVTPKEMTVFGA